MAVRQGLAGARAPHAAARADLAAESQPGWVALQEPARV